MSVQINQYLIWGVRRPYEWHQDWEEQHPEAEGFYEHFESFMDDNAFKEGVNHKDGIFCLYDGANGNFIFVGRVVQKSKDGQYLAENEPLAMPVFTQLEKEFIRISIERNFGLTEECQFWIVTAAS